MDKRWHVYLEQVLSKRITKKYEMVIAAATVADAINGVLERTYEIDAFTPLKGFKVLHVIEW